MVVRKVGETGAPWSKPHVTTEDTSQTCSGLRHLQATEPADGLMLFWWCHQMIVERGWTFSLHSMASAQHHFFYIGCLKLSAATSRPVFGLPLRGLEMNSLTEEKNLQMALGWFDGFVRWSLKIEAVQLSSLGFFKIHWKQQHPCTAWHCTQVFKNGPSEVL